LPCRIEIQFFRQGGEDQPGNEQEETHAEAQKKNFCRAGRSKSAQRVKGQAIALFGEESTAPKPTADLRR